MPCLCLRCEAVTRPSGHPGAPPPQRPAPSPRSCVSGQPQVMGSGAACCLLWTHKAFCLNALPRLLLSVEDAVSAFRKAACLSEMCCFMLGMLVCSENSKEG